jgi:hypothetical protein
MRNLIIHRAEGLPWFSKRLFNYLWYFSDREEPSNEIPEWIKDFKELIHSLCSVQNPVYGKTDVSWKFCTWNCVLTFMDQITKRKDEASIQKKQVVAQNKRF